MWALLAVCAALTAASEVGEAAALTLGGFGIGFVKCKLVSNYLPKAVCNTLIY